MMTIRADQIVQVLDDNLKLYEEGKKARNICFVCTGREMIREIVRGWLTEHGIDPIYDPYPGILHEQDLQGYVHKTNPPVYAFWSSLQKQMNQPFLFYFSSLNHGTRDVNRDPMLADLVSKEKVSNPPFEALDLSKKMFALAFAYSDDSGWRIAKMNEDLAASFDFYYVSVSLQFTLNYTRETLMGLIADLNHKKDQEEDQEAKDDFDWHLKECEKVVGFIDWLIASGFDMEDCCWQDRLYEYIWSDIFSDVPYDPDLEPNLKGFAIESLKGLLLNAFVNDKGGFVGKMVAASPKRNESYQAIVAWLKSL